MIHKTRLRHLLAAASLLFCVGATLSPGPEIQNFSLDTTSPGNLTTDDLICTYDLAGTATTAATAWYRNDVPLMALYMPMEGGAAAALEDFSGNGLAASAAGGPAWGDAAGFDNLGAYQFDGTDDALIVPDNAVLDADYVTLSAWIYVTSYVSDQRIISKETGTSQPYSI
ncbi:MAG: hypothetical protein PVF33_12295, partial [Candidatus Latescibacterota bacterium]